MQPTPFCLLMIKLWSCGKSASVIRGQKATIWKMRRAGCEILPPSPPCGWAQLSFSFLGNQGQGKSGHTLAAIEGYESQGWRREIRQEPRLPESLVADEGARRHHTVMTIRPRISFCHQGLAHRTTTQYYVPSLSLFPSSKASWASSRYRDRTTHMGSWNLVMQDMNF